MPRTIDVLLDQYSDSHRNPTNELIHIVCVPVIVFTLLSEMQIPLYDRTIKPYLFTSHMLAWKGFFYTKVDAGGSAIPGTIENLHAIMKSFWVLIVYITGFVASAIFIFNRKDILS